VFLFAISFLLSVLKRIIVEFDLVGNHNLNTTLVLDNQASISWSLKLFYSSKSLPSSAETSLTAGGIYTLRELYM
jgi:hypothetical protein